MKIKGVIRGRTIELDVPTGLPEGQSVEVEVRAEPAQSARTDPEHPSAAKADAKVSSHVLSPNVQAADALRRKIAERLENGLDLSVRFVREDRDR